MEGLGKEETVDAYPQDDNVGKDGEEVRHAAYKQRLCAWKEGGHGEHRGVTWEKARGGGDRPKSGWKSYFHVP